MSKLIVVNNPKDWPISIPGLEVISAKDYLMNEKYLDDEGLRVFNLCRTYRYQSTGYYVSLLAAARGHKAFPSMNTIQEMKYPSVVRVITEDIDDLIQKSFGNIQSGKFDLSIYFGKNVAKKYDQLSEELFRLFQAPLLRAHFIKRDDKWRLSNIQLISTNEIPDEHVLYVIMFAENYFSKKIYRARARKILPYDMGILVNNLEENPPSNKRFFKRLDKAAEKFGFNIEMIDKDDYHRIAEFDALFIRETTSVNHHTFRMAQRAHVEGLVVIDDPSSILKCTNKVYLAELMEHNHIPAPETIILSRENMNCAPDSLGFPIILKKPDSSFSQGVVKVESRDEYMQQANQLLEKSDLIIAQKFVPTDFDWRIGILDRQPLYACKYWMAKAHWQIMDWKKKGNARFGNVETVPIEQVPPRVVKLALRAANLIGDGLYGVDIKCSNNNYYIIEVNDNPTIEGGEEDQVLKDELYVRLMDVFLRRVQIKKDGSWKI